MFLMNKIKNWFSEHWTHVTAVTLFILFIMNGVWQKLITDSLAEENAAEYLRHTEDLQRLQEIHTSEMAAQRAITEQLQTDLNRIENEYARRIADIEVRQRTRRQITVQETNGNPQEMALILQRRLGWRIEQ